MKEILLCTALIVTSIVYGTDVNFPCGGDDWIAYKDEKCVKLFKSFVTRHQAAEVCNQQGPITGSLAPSLVTINSAAEQKFLTEYIFDASDSNNVWIGAERRLDNITEFHWSDGSLVQRFTNWATGHPTDNVIRSCVHMRSPFTRNDSEMRWVDLSCTSSNWFICQKLQAWPMAHFQQIILNMRKEMEELADNFSANQLQIADLRNNVNASQSQITANQLQITSSQSQITASQAQIAGLRSDVTASQSQITASQSQIAGLRSDVIASQSQINTSQSQISDLRSDVTASQSQINASQSQISGLRSDVTATQSQITASQSQITSIQANPVPIGFIYVQLPNQPEPRNTWPTVGWTEITSQYAGLFFRVVGGGSAAFGTVQAESSPRLTEVNRFAWSVLSTNRITLPIGGWSSLITTGREAAEGTATHYDLQFHTSADEVRPRNQAVRIWRRI